MSIFDGFFMNDDSTKKETKERDAKMLLRKEELDINKRSVHKGDVEFGKEIIEEKMSVDVPVMREEVVIERKAINNVASDSPITEDGHTIKIPVSEEKVNVGKHTVITGEISAHKRSIEDTQHIDENLKREEARINKKGNADIVDIELHD